MGQFDMGYQYKSTSNADPEAAWLKSRNGSPSSSLTCHSSTCNVMDLEIDRRCDPLYKSTNSNRNIQITLHNYQDVPLFLKGNPYVVHGYRVDLPFSACLKSVFVWSNETINIWSHLSGFVLFFLLMIWDNAVSLPDLGSHAVDHVIITLGLLCFQFCMLCSSGYHLFRCHSERTSVRWLALDLTGISVGLIGCYLPGVHYSFYCLSVWRDLYLLIMTVLFTAVMFFQTQPGLYTHTSFYKLLLIYMGLVAYGIIPTIHWINLNGGFSSEIVQIFTPKVTVMYILGLFAFVFYITKFPERCFPGRFDFIGSSHQVWHIIVVVAFYWWHQAGLQMLQYRLNQPCIS